jgi:Spy/CpxP family protein refolding chaperone
MNTSRSIIVAFLAASSIALGVSAAVAGGHDRHGRGYCNFHGKAGQGNLQERFQAYQERLRKALKLTAAQEPAWTTFIQKTTPKANDLPHPDPEAFRKLSTPERAEKLLEFSKQRQAFLSERLGALKTFYAVLTPEQKQVFDDYHSGSRGKHGKRGEQKKKPRSKKD